MMAGEMQGEVFAGSHHLPPGEFSPLMNEIVIGANGTLELFHGTSICICTSAICFEQRSPSATGLPRH